MLLMPAPYSEPRSFVWFPLAGLRHAIDRRDRDVLPGGLMRCLCGATHPRGPDGDTERLWATCQQCWDKTCLIVGLQPQR
jgi:zinc-finger